MILQSSMVVEEVAGISPLLAIDSEEEGGGVGLAGWQHEKKRRRNFFFFARILLPLVHRILVHHADIVLTIMLRQVRENNALLQGAIPRSSIVTP